MDNITELEILLHQGENLLNIVEPNNSMFIDAPRLDSRKTQEWKLKTLTSLKKTIDDEDELYIEFKKYTQTNYKHEIEKAVSTLKIIIETLEKNSIPKNNQFNQDIIETILNKFHKVVIELDFKIQTENDVKKLLKALLGIHYDNIKSEEHVESYAGVSSRIDLYIKDINYGIEIKLAKNSINHEKIVEQINDDIKKYQKLSNCEKIYFFIYNPESLITNHVSLENELPSKEGNINITTIVNPKVYHPTT